MNPFNLFLVLAIVGAVIAMGAVVITECRDAELVRLPATISDKQVVVRERTVTTTQPAGGCPKCPGSNPSTVTVTTIVQEEAYYVTVTVEKEGKVGAERVEVAKGLFEQLKAGDKVEYRFLRGKTSGRLCSRPEIAPVPNPA